MKQLQTGASLGKYLLLLSLQAVGHDINRAPRFPEPAGIENPTLAPEEGTAVCCPLPRDGNFIGDLYVGGNLTVVGTISGSILVNPPLILQPAVGSQACIIF